MTFAFHHLLKLKYWSEGQLLVLNQLVHQQFLTINQSKQLRNLVYQLDVELLADV